MTYLDGMVTTYGYGVTGRLNTIGVKLAGTSTTLSPIGSVNNYPSGPQLKWTYGNGRVLNRTHDTDYRPTAINDTAAGGVQMGLGYDAAGRIDRLFDPATSVNQLRYAYDGLDRLTATQDGATLDPVENYAYDATGNRTSVTFKDSNLQPVMQTYTYAPFSHWLTGIDAATRTYDPAGNTLTMNGRTFVYTPVGRLGDVSGGPAAMSYTYNGLGEQGRRYQTRPASQTGAQDHYVYGERGHWIGSYDVNGAMKQQIVWLEDYPVGLVNASGPKYIEPDHLGTPRAVIEVARNVAVWKWDAKSEAFGNTLPSENPDGDAFSLVFDMRFPGQRFDAATGMTYNYYRHYDAGTGRYGQSDPIGLVGG